MTRTLVVLFALAVAVPAVACLWDYDTLAMENQRFPEALELITGKFVRPGPAHYTWRIANRIERLKADPKNLAWLDDLAVAYDKTGQSALALETAQKALEIAPQRYETLANLGTIHLHAGQVEAGLGFIAKAIAVNPQAHFGREVYQQLLAEFGRDKAAAAAAPGSGSEAAPTPQLASFTAYVTAKKGAADTPNALKGILGIMRFGDHTRPAVLEALGDLLIDDTGRQDAKLLAARAYLKASYGTEDAAAKAAYRQRAQAALSMQTPDGKSPTEVTLDRVETDFKAELAAAQAWTDALLKREQDWIAAGVDVDAELAALYAAPAADGDADDEEDSSESDMQDRAAKLGVCAFLAGAAFVVRRRLNRGKAATPTA